MGIEVVVAHSDRATLRVDDVFLKVDTNPASTDTEVQAMALAPVPTPEVLWRRPPVLALAALPGTALGRYGVPSAAAPAAWSAAGAAVRALQEAPLPPWPGWDQATIPPRLDAECAWLVDSTVVPADLVTRHRAAAEAAFRPFTPVFIHGDLQPSHVFVEHDEVTGVLDWSEAGPGDPLADLAVLTLGHPERLADALIGYGGDVDVDLVRAWWSLRALWATRWVIEHGFDPAPELAVLTVRP